MMQRYDIHQIIPVSGEVWLKCRRKFGPHHTKDDGKRWKEKVYAFALVTTYTRKLYRRSDGSFEESKTEWEPESCPGCFTDKSIVPIVDAGGYFDVCDSNYEEVIDSWVDLPDDVVKQ